MANGMDCDSGDSRCRSSDCARSLAVQHLACPAPEQMPRSISAGTRRDSIGLDIGARFGIVIGMRRITDSCGHEQEHYIIGEYAADYEKQAARLSRGECAPCRTQAAALIGLQNQTAAAELGLATLHGSPKQIAWAETIRIKRLSKLGPSEAVALVARITDAKWWIDRRSDGDDGLVASAVAFLSISASAR